MERAENAGLVDIAHLLLGPILQGRRIGNDLGVVDQDIDGAELFDCGRDHATHFALHPHVTGNGQRARANRFELMSSLVECFSDDVDDDDGRAFFREGQGLASADSACRTGNYRNLSIE